LLGIIATFYGGCALALGMYTFAEPWTTGVQVQHRLGAEASYEKRYEPRPLSALDDDLPMEQLGSIQPYLETSASRGRSVGPAAGPSRPSVSDN
jgi:hypothetical protein